MNDDPSVVPPPVETADIQTPSSLRTRNRLHGFLSILLILFCFELGVFLIVYPWTESWTNNYFSFAVPDSMITFWRTLWNNSYLRGAVSGLGMVNIWIGMAEILRIFTRRRPAA